MGENNFEMLEKLFGVFYKLSLSLQVFATHRDILLGSAKSQLRCGKVYASLLQVTANATLYYCQKTSCGSFQCAYTERLLMYFLSCSSSGEIW